jgi:radical SAM/Cys-rich protein
MTTDSVLAPQPSTNFSDRIVQSDPIASRAERIDTLTVNVGLRCDRTCAQCHHTCSPTASESMTRATMQDAVRLAGALRPALLDITGGEPSLWPHLREFVAEARAVGVPRIRVRTNLSGLLDQRATGVAADLARQGVEVLASMPSLPVDGGDRRIAALLALRDLGYGDGGDCSLPLDLAHTPEPGALPHPQRDIERAFRKTLSDLGIRFRSLLQITGVPLGGLAQRLAKAGLLTTYRATLRDGFNPEVVRSLECRHGIEIAWDGRLYDCDFNVAAHLPLRDQPRTAADALAEPAAVTALASRRIAFGEHCFACAAGAGSG